MESLFKIVEDLKQKGIGIIYITHRLAEVFQIATHVAIMRDGIITLKGRVADFTREMLVKGLLPPNMDESELKDGRDTAGALNYEGLEPVFELKHYSGYGFEDVNLKVYPGEVLGVAGVVGAGRTELATTIFGRDKVLKGKAILDGKDVTGLSTDPKLVILDEPTRGIDAAARGDVYSIIHKLKAQGVAIMLISSDMEEIVELSDRAVVVFSGRIKGELSKSEISQASLMAASFGVAEE